MNILWLGEPQCHDIARVGAKAANLSRLAAHYHVPAGFCVTATAFEQCGPRLLEIEQPTATPSMAPELYKELAAAYKNLALRLNIGEPQVAVRSSAVDEDGAAASFAGQHETYLNVSGIDYLAEAVVRCWGSAGAQRAQQYRKRQGLTEGCAGLAVLVQELVFSDVSAVAFSVNPVTGNRDEVMINASWGLGECVVNGSVNPDVFMAHKTDFSIIERDVARKDVMCVATSQGTQLSPVPLAMRTQRSLSDRQVQEIASLCVNLEHEMGWPVDIECAYSRGCLQLLQCRPITTLSQA